ncbi:MAG: hypothetical protein LBU19_07335 [Treponema sp.]|jgi:hypothetical protein|nr:hypothetical protein [Treponema sp.]
MKNSGAVVRKFKAKYPNLLVAKRVLKNDIIGILELCTEVIFGAEFFGYKKLPAFKIIINDDAAWRGMANCFPVKELSSNSYGHKLRFRMDYVAIKKYLFCPGKFAAVHSTYLHELCHVFGGDSSPNFSGALSDIIEAQLLSVKQILLFSERWDEIDSRGDSSPDDS